MLGLDAFTISSLKPFHSLKTRFGRKWLLCLCLYKKQ
ncbi:unnamed protein product [Tenebrio molitor]|nr:unnamed protein product [Tenebrio molitor]